jgi:hypothetical protein
MGPPVTKLGALGLVVGLAVVIYATFHLFAAVLVSLGFGG